MDIYMRGTSTGWYTHQNTRSQRCKAKHKNPLAIIDNLKHVIKQHTHNNENAKLWTYIYGEQTKGGIHSKIDVDKDAKPST